jgi:predicted transcriptional regulator
VLLKEMMTKDVITISPDASLKEAGQMLKTKRISGLPVVENGNIVGVITITDMMKIIEEIYRWHEIEKTSTGLNLSDLVGKERLNSKVRNIMTKNVYTLDEDKKIEDVMHLMFGKKIHTIPITKDNKLVGIIGKRDVTYACF